MSIYDYPLTPGECHMLAKGNTATINIVTIEVCYYQEPSSNWWLRLWGATDTSVYLVIHGKIEQEERYIKADDVVISGVGTEQYIVVSRHGADITLKSVRNTQLGIGAISFSKEVAVIYSTFSEKRC